MQCEYKLGEQIWVLSSKGEFQHRTVTRNYPYFVHTELLEGEPDKDEQGMFITFHYHLKARTGRTKEEVLRNLMEHEASKIVKAKRAITVSERRINKWGVMLSNLTHSQFSMGATVNPNLCNICGQLDCKHLKIKEDT